MTVYPYVYREHEMWNPDQSQKERFIPMCIGNTILYFFQAFSFSVYPYVYREHFK